MNENAPVRRGRFESLITDITYSWSTQLDIDIISVNAFVHM